MCYPCKHCGHCEKSRPKPLGMCPMCKTMNEPGAQACTECGFRFPPSPGKASGGDAVGIGNRIRERKTVVS